MNTTIRSVSIVIPCYNEEKTIQPVIEELLRTTTTIEGINWEIIIIDDKSIDSSATIASQIKNIKLIRHHTNKGYGAAIKTGIRASQGEVIVTMDADGQHIPSEILKLLDNIEDCDMVVGWRVNQANMPFLRRIGKKILSFVISFLAMEKIPDFNSGLRVIRKQTILKYLCLCSNGFSFSTTSTLALLSERCFIKFIPIDYRKRSASTSQVTIFTAFDTLLLIAQSIMVFNPLRIFLPFAFTFGIAGFCSLCLDLIHKNIADTTILLFTMTVFSLFFGLLADQVAHIRRERMEDRIS